jgi:hypothetical protein
MTTIPERDKMAFSDLPLLQPVRFAAAVRELTPPQNNYWLNRVPREQTTDQQVAWDTYKGTQKVGKPNVPNSEAHIISVGERSARAASWMYLRTKMGFKPTTTRNLRQIGTRLDQRRAEEAVLRDAQQISNQFDNFAEMCFWSVLSGHLHAEFRDNVWKVNFGIPESHQFVPGVPWDQATPAQIMADLNAWRDTIENDSQTIANDVYATKNTIALIFQSFARVDDGTAAGLLTDRMREQYYRTGTFDDFLGMNWRVVNAKYQMDSGSYAGYVPDGALFIGNYTDNRPLVLMEGPSYDFAAPQNYTGKFAKNWMNDDPSGLWFLVEWSMMPILFTPDQVGFCRSVAPGKFPGM